MSEPSRPISPSALLEKFLSTSYKESECVDEASSVKEQKEILASLIQEYNMEIQKKISKIKIFEDLFRIRNELRVELERVRQERIGIDRDFEYEIEKNKVSPALISDHSNRKMEVEELKVKNLGLEGRLRELNEYAYKMEKHNMILTQDTMEVPMVIAKTEGIKPIWREKVHATRQHSQHLELEIKNREVRNREQVRIQEDEIAERNRRRMEIIHEKVRRI